MNTEDLDLIRFVTRNFRRLQGLQMVSAGLLVLAFGVWEATAAPLFLWPALIVGVLLWRRAHRYYLARFGEVEPQPRRNRDAILAFVLFLLMIASDALGKRGLYPQDLLVYAFLGLLFLWLLLSFSGGARRYEVHYLVFGVLFLGLALPARPLAALLPGLYRPGFDSILGGLAFILAGLLDHQLLVRSLGQAPEFSEEAAVQEIES
jgi:hypothetical protein